MPSERSVRHRAKRLGYHVTKSRERKHVPHNRFCYMLIRFCYMLINANRNLVVLGERHHASLEEIDEFLKAARAA